MGPWGGEEIEFKFCEDIIMCVCTTVYDELEAKVSLFIHVISSILAESADARNTKRSCG